MRGSNPLTIKTPKNAVAKKAHCIGLIDRCPSKYRANSTVKIGERYWDDRCACNGNKPQSMKKKWQDQWFRKYLGSGAICG